MHSSKNSLKKYNTFGVNAFCRNIVPIYSDVDLFKYLAEDHGPFMVLGGGSNVLFVQDYDGDVLSMQIKGISIIDEDDQQVLVRVGAGENWHQFVLWAVSHDLGGIENLSLIPGSVGAAPIQNIGAYGIEQENAFHSLNYIDIEEGITHTMYKSDCKFGYRDSIFKQDMKGKAIITHVSYLLTKYPPVNVSYSDVQKKISDLGITDISIKDVSSAIIDIRSAKLPDPNKIGNAGSFFKNPVINQIQFDDLIKKHPNMVNYPSRDGVKLAAAWLIDQCGFKGLRHGNTGSYHNQALVIVNHGNATGSEILEYAKIIQQKVKDTFGITLEMEVNVIP